MRRDRRAPALYELIRGPVAMNPPASPASGPAATPPASSSPAGTARASVPTPVRPAPQPMVAHVAAAPNATEGQPLFGGPGQSVTVSIRTIWAAVAIACIVLVVAYVMGYKQHERKTLDDRTKLTQEQFDGVVDPTLNPSGTSPAASSTPVNPSLISPGPGERRPIDGAGTGGEGASSLLIVKRAQDDPREEGMNYFIVANLPFDEAKRAGDFLAGRGVASALLPRDNRGFCQVVALRGFPAGTLDSTECVQYKERLRSIGREYKRTQKGPTDFADLFPRKYRRATG